MQTIFKKIFLVFVSIFVIFLILEGGVRLWGMQSADVYQDDTYIARKYTANIDRMRQADGGGMVHFKTNTYGFIGDDWSTGKEEGTLRIASLGDSFTAGVDVDFDKTYSYVLADRLTQLLDGEVEGLNFGIAGQGTGHALQTYEHYARLFNPDVVVLWYFLGNDFEDNLIHEEGTEDGFDERASLIKRIGRKSELAWLVVNKLAQIPFAAKLMYGTVLTRVGHDTLGDPRGLPLTLRILFTEDKENEKALAQTKKYLGLLRDNIDRDDKKLFVAMIPVPFQVEKELEKGMFEQYPQLSEANYNNRRPNGELEQILADLSIDSIDLTSDFQGVCDNDPAGHCGLYACPHCHLSQEGHRFAASLVADALIKEDFFGEELSNNL